MALIVEDGTGLSTAEAYVSVADAEIYMTKIYGTAEALWTAATDAAKEQALRRAATYLDGTYSFVGSREVATQALEWPRFDAVRNDDFSVTGSLLIEGVPSQMEDASVEMALLVINGITIFPTTTEGGNVKRIRVGSIEKEFSEKNINQVPLFHKVTAFLRYIIQDPSRILRS